MDFQTCEVMFGEVRLHFGEDLRVVGAVFVQPKNGGGLGEARAVDGEFYPVADGGVFGLATPPDVACVDLMGEAGLSAVVDDANRAFRRDFEGFVVRTVFLGGLRHEADVGDAPHSFWVERAVGTAEIKNSLVDAGVAAVWDEREGLLKVAFGIVHFAAGANHGGHGGVDNDVAGDVKVGDAFVRVHVGERGSV